MELPKKFLRDRVVLVLITLIAVFMVVGVSIVFLRFDISKNPTTIVAYRPSISGSSFQSGKPIDIYSLAAFVVVTAIASVVLSARIYSVKRAVSLFILSSAVFLLILATIVSNALISLQ
jgi:hypothetical protein